VRWIKRETLFILLIINRLTQKTVATKDDLISVQRIMCRDIIWRILPLHYSP
jgi:hypothetical protein